MAMRTGDAGVCMISIFCLSPYCTPLQRGREDFLTQLRTTLTRSAVCFAFLVPTVNCESSTPPTLPRLTWCMDVCLTYQTFLFFTLHRCSSSPTPPAPSPSLKHPFLSPFALFRHPRPPPTLAWCSDKPPARFFLGQNTIIIIDFFR